MSYDFNKVFKFRTKYYYGNKRTVFLIRNVLDKKLSLNQEPRFNFFLYDESVCMYKWKEFCKRVIKIKIIKKLEGEKP